MAAHTCADPFPAACTLLPATPSGQVAALQRQLSDANASAVEIRAASHALIDLVGDAPALAAMLHCYSHKVGRSQALLLKQHAAGAEGGRWQGEGRVTGILGSVAAGMFGACNGSTVEQSS
jgi:hypothetical protein